MMEEPPKLNLIIDYDKKNKIFQIKRFHEFSKKIITEDWSLEDFTLAFMSEDSRVIPTYKGVKEYAKFYWPELFI